MREDLLAGRRQRADRHHQRIDDRRPRAGCRGPRRVRRSSSRPRSARRGPRRCRSRRWRSRRPPRRTCGPAAGRAPAAPPRRSRSSRAACPGRPRGRPRAPRRSRSRSRAARRTSDCTSWIVLARMAGSSASGMPALTSSMCAPASTWASASRSTRLKSPLLHLLGEQLAAGGVDALADDHERPVEADHDLARGGADDGARHGAPAPVGSSVCGRLGSAARPPSRCDRAAARAVGSRRRRRRAVQASACTRSRAARPRPPPRPDVVAARRAAPCATRSM